MEYQVPQFIEVEDKIIGPLTLKQFIYVAGAGGLCVVFFVYLPIIIALLLSAPVAALAAALAFYKVNGKPFIEVLEAGFKNPKYKPCPLLREMVASGRLGKKIGKGFYDY